MKQKIIFIGAIVLLALGIVGFGYYKATSGPIGNNENNPKIEITPASYDLGEIAFGKIVNYTFKIKNSGNEILEIKRVATSCGCTTAKASKTKINPGEEAELLVVYDTAAMGNGPHGKGNQKRIIYVKSSDPANPQVDVIIFAYVK